jgi:2-methylisocitrate lyase-like PEP mutase family enzyme
MTTASRARRLRQQLGGPDIVVVPGAADAITARIIEAAGFPAVYATGAGFANASFAIPDVGLVSVTEVIDHVRRMADSVDIPLVVDADTGYGGVLNVYRTVRQLERAGAAAIQLEDQSDPKRCGHFDGQMVVPAQAMLGKLAAALDARTDPDVLIIARTDARESEGFPAAVERAQAYAEAGADVIFLEAPRTVDELATVPARIPAPCLVNIVEGGKTPELPALELQKLGYKIALFANTALRVGIRAVESAMSTLRAEGTTKSLIPDMVTWDERQQLIGLADAQAREDRYYGAAAS